MAEELQENDCAHVWQIAATERCEWVKNQKYCDSDSIVHYTHLLFCTFTTESTVLFAIGLSVIGLWLLYLFLILGTTADNFFCPSLGVIASVLHLSENIAGVTILAFGNGAPDIFTSLVSDDREMVIMFTELIGAGVFVTAIIAGSVALVSPFRVPLKSFTRDCCFYIISVCWISYASHDEIIHLWEALSLIGIYISFILIVVAMQFHDNREEKRKGRIPRLRDPELLKTYVAYQRASDRRHSDLHPGVGAGGLPLRSRAYSLQAKLDVAIATEMAREMGGTEGGGNRSGDNRATNDAEEAASSHDQPTLPPSTHRPTGLFREFLYDLNPINAQDWQAANFMIRTILVLRAPAMFLLQLMIPVVNETAEKRGWSKLLNCLQLFITPILALFKLNVWHQSVGPVPILPIFFVVSLAIAVIVFIKTDVQYCPKYHDAFAFLGFAGAMLVVYVVANEVMAVLQCIGYASRISEAMLGITLLAWGNSVGDLISNVAIARRGFPRMGYSACFGGPLFNTLLGLGLSWAISASRNDDYRTKVRSSDMMPGCVTFLLASLVASVIYLNAVGFLARRSYGYLLYSIYSAFMLINILSECDFIHPLGTDHRND